MRFVVATACLAAGLASASASTLTVLLDLPDEQNAVSIKAMTDELRVQMRSSGVKLDIRMKSAALQNEVFDDVVQFRFRGSCRMADYAQFMDERGPLAWTHTSDGDVLPFGEVSCDRVRRAVQSALWGGERGQRDRLFGRALGRVVAHELVHMLQKSHAHTRTGFTKAALSGSDLIQTDLP